MTNTRRVVVALVPVGDPLFVDLRKLCGKLNSLSGQEAFEFRIVPESVPCEGNGARTNYVPTDSLEASAISPLYTDRCILDEVERVLGPRYEQEFVVAITSLRLTVDSKPWTGDYLGVWGEGGARPTQPRGVISLPLWYEKYEQQARRTVEQYIAFILVSFLGDNVFHDQRLSHTQYRRCAFDYNDDLDSIVGSIRRSALCDNCRRKLQDKSRRLRKEEILRTAIVDSLDAMLKYSRVPTLGMFVRSLSDRPLFSFLVVTVLFGLAMSFVTAVVGEDSSFYAAVVMLFFSALAFFGYYLSERSDSRIFHR